MILLSIFDNRAKWVHNICMDEYPYEEKDKGVMLLLFGIMVTAVASIVVFIVWAIRDSIYILLFGLY